MELINTIGTRVQVRDEHADRLLAAGYRHPDRDLPHAKPARRTTSRTARTRKTTADPADGS